MKDNFSHQADKYLLYRPSYPAEIFSFLIAQLRDTKTAWDCGTGNGQVAVELAKYFDVVYATDISAQQIENAIDKQNIIYSVQPAETTNSADNTFDLITVAQAIHWFDFEKFYGEVKRVAKPQAIVAVIGYGLIKTFDEADAIIEGFYFNTVGKFWDAERKYIDDNYRTIPFPFQEIETPKFSNELYWNFEHLIGYLGTWSAVKHYIKAKGENPINLIEEKLKQCWGNETRKVRFDILLRVGKID
jgi:ubiquinone/menaquinone biosynthesis C-methylase UbiE